MTQSKSLEKDNEGGHRPPSPVERLVGAITWFVAVLGAGVVILMMSVVGYSVVNRYILGTPVTWTDELSGYLVVALVMLGAAESLRRGDHIAVDLISNHFGPKLKRLSAIWGNLAVLIVAVAILISGKATLDYSINFEILSEGYLEVPMWIPQSFLILGSGLLALVATVNLFKLVIREVGP